LYREVGASSVQILTVQPIETSFSLVTVLMVSLHTGFVANEEGIALTLLEWLFKQVACVVHHGGAGTTACGLLNGCPTTIVPFFGE